MSTTVTSHLRPGVYSVYEASSVVGRSPRRGWAGVVGLSEGGTPGKVYPLGTQAEAAQAFGKELVYHEPSAQRIRDRFAARGTPVTENNFQQAMVPEGCTVLDNDWGTAPGVAFASGGTHVLMLPGPPRECEKMFRHRALPYLQKLSDGVIASRTVKTFGIGESAAEALLRDLMNALHNPTLAPYAKEGECELRVTAKAPTMEQAQALLLPKVEELKARFGTRVYGVDVSSLEEVVEDLLREKGLTLGCAESITGGLMAKRLTDIPGSSQVFRGGVVSYTNEVKAGVLGVPQHLLDQFGAVSPEVARAMADGARRLLGCDIALSATGVAGPGKDEWDHEVGTAFVAISTAEGAHVRALNLGSRPVRARLRTQTAHHAFDLARRYLSGLPFED